MIEVLANMMVVIILSYINDQINTLNLHNVMHQLYLNKSKWMRGRKGRSEGEIQALKPSMMQIYF